MTFHGVLSVLLLPVCRLVAAAAAEETTSDSNAGITAAPRPPTTNSTQNGMIGGLNVDSAMIQRALYVLIGITIIGVLYFLIRAVRLKRPVQKKKYGLLSNYEDSVEMEAVESDEDDTLYEARSLRR